MKLRWKYFLVLVAASLVPLLVVTWISQNASRRLGKTISGKAQNTLTDTVKQEMVRATRSYAAFSLLGGQTTEFALRILAAKAELALALFFVGIVSFFTSRFSTGHILTLIDAWKRVAKGDFSVRLKPRMKDERDQLIHAFNEIVPKIEEHMRMSNALGLAQEVQQSLLPQSDPSFPGFDIAGASIYCDETGGDYYDFIETNRDGQPGLAVVVGDVSGHGVSSALLMATARALIMLRSSMPGEAAGIIKDVNRYLSLDTAQTGNFMTFFYCELTQRKPEVRWVRAGHDPALIYDPSTDVFDELKGQGPALGLDSSFEYDSFHRRIETGQVILIGTDGIWEMHNKAGDMFGKKGLREIIRNNHRASARQIVDTVTDALDQFRGDEAPEDDITLVVIKVDR
jgi:sigma-B regulation protein RsbU (phosphoserine phosphatase)